ncbi:MAG: helix-turn-helix domain-containing protein [Agitococcus sp.]
MGISNNHIDDSLTTEHEAHALVPMQLHLWEHRSLFLGSIPEPVECLPACAWLLVGLNSPFEVAVNDSPRVHTRIALIPASGELRYLPSDGLLACCFLDVLGRDYRTLSQNMVTIGDGLYIGIRDSIFETNVINTLSQCYAGTIAASKVYQHLIESLSLPSPTPEGQMQNTIANIVNSVKQTAAGNLTNAHYATEAGISEDVLSRWFKQVTGLTLRRYRNWHRIFLAAGLMQHGISLTESAHAVGFSDAAHFNHVFREMLGLKPSFIQRAMAYTSIYFSGMLVVDKTTNKGAKK